MEDYIDDIRWNCFSNDGEPDENGYFLLGYGLFEIKVWGRMVLDDLVGRAEFAKVRRMLKFHEREDEYRHIRERYFGE